jgi:hypothetical protein
VDGTHGEIVAVRGERDRAALLPLPPSEYLVVERTTRVVARDGLFSFDGRRYHVSGATPGERVELALGATELEVHSLRDGRRICRHERGCPRLALPDPVEHSMSLATVLDSIPKVEVHRRPLATRSWSMGELINARIRRNAHELKLHGITENPDELIDRAGQA